MIYTNRYTFAKNTHKIHISIGNQGVNIIIIRDNPQSLCRLVRTIKIVSSSTKGGLPLMNKHRISS